MKRVLSLNYLFYRLSTYQVYSFTRVPIHYTLNLMASNINEENTIINTDSEPKFKPYRKAREHPDIDTRGKKKFKPSDEDYFDKCHFHVEHNLQFVKPYFFNFRSNAKARWFGRSIIDVTCTEFSSRPYQYYAKVIGNGRLKLNGKKITNFDEKVKNGDFISHFVHRHEPPVLNTPIKVLYQDENMFVINKPSSIPVHPSGRFHFNTLVNILHIKYGFEDVHSVHRLDRLTSGIMIFARNTKKSRQLHKLMQRREISKEYVCLVNGKFPESVVVNEPIKCVSHNIGVCQITCDLDEGKPSETIFALLSFNGERSLVKCEPKTGRMHQIRVHLQHLGFPIVNDPIYNHPAWELPKYGKSKPIPPEKVDEMLKLFLKEIVKQENASEENFNEADSCGEKSSSGKEIIPVEKIKSKIPDDYIMQHPLDYGGIKLTQTELQAIYTKLNPNTDPMCIDCTALKNIPQMSMFLHALSYKSSDWEFRTRLPEWAQEFEFETKSDYKDYISMKEDKSIVDSN